MIVSISLSISHGLLIQSSLKCYSVDAIIIPILQRTNRDTEQLNDMAKVPELGSGCARVWIRQLDSHAQTQPLVTGEGEHPI